MNNNFQIEAIVQMEGLSRDLMSMVMGGDGPVVPDCPTLYACPTYLSCPVLQACPTLQSICFMAAIF